MSSNSNKRTSTSIKSKRDVFEEQLKTLQEDISILSQKINPNQLSHLNGINSNSNGFSKHLNGFVKDSSKDSLEKILIPVVDVTSKNNFQNEIVELKKEVAKCRQTIEQLNKDKADSLFREELLQKEIDELRGKLQETENYRQTIDHYKQDNESLKISLESSERIRKQQKELILILQKSHSLNDNKSITSMKSISTIPHQDDLSTIASFTPSIIAAENRSWLNSYETAASNKLPPKSNIEKIFKDPPPVPSNETNLSNKLGIAERNDKSNAKKLSDVIDISSTVVHASPTPNDTMTHTIKKTTKISKKKDSAMNRRSESANNTVNRRSESTNNALTDGSFHRRSDTKNGIIGKPPRFPSPYNRSNSLSTPSTTVSSTKSANNNSLKYVRFVQSANNKANDVTNKSNRNSSPSISKKQAKHRL